MINFCTNIMNRLRNLCKRAYISLANKNDGDFNVAQLSYMGKTQNVEIMYPYGMSGIAPVNSRAVVWQLQAQEENLVGLEYKNTNRFKPENAGELYIGNQETGAVIKFLDNGNIQIDTTGNIIVNAADATINNDVTINGDLTVSGTIFNSLRTNYNAHKHLSNGPGNLTNATDSPD